MLTLLPGWSMPSLFMRPWPRRPGTTGGSSAAVAAQPGHLAARRHAVRSASPGKGTPSAEETGRSSGSVTPRSHGRARFPNSTPDNQGYKKVARTIDQALGDLARYLNGIPYTVTVDGLATRRLWDGLHNNKQGQPGKPGTTWLPGYTLPLGQQPIAISRVKTTDPAQAAWAIRRPARPPITAPARRRPPKERNACHLRIPVRAPGLAGSMMWSRAWTTAAGHRREGYPWASERRGGRPCRGCRCGTVRATRIT